MTVLGRLDAAPAELRRATTSTPSRVFTLMSGRLSRRTLGPVSLSRRCMIQSLIEVGWRGTTEYGLRAKPTGSDASSESFKALPASLFQREELKSFRLRCR